MVPLCVRSRRPNPIPVERTHFSRWHSASGISLLYCELWNLECPDPSPEAFIFPNADGGLIDTANYRSRILKPLADGLGIPKLNFQVLRRTMATRAQNLGSVKDIQSHLRHSRADTTANEYMQELPESVQQMVGTVYEMLTSATARSWARRYEPV